MTQALIGTQNSRPDSLADFPRVQNNLRCHKNLLGHTSGQNSNHRQKLGCSGARKSHSLVCKAESISFPSPSGGASSGKGRGYDYGQVWQQNSADSKLKRPASKSEAHRPRSSPPVRKQKTKPEKGASVSSSLFVDFGKLPPDGRSVTLEEETCDPMEQRCKTAVHVWEEKCKKCYGCGIVTQSSRRGSRHSCTCLACHGLGYVRQASAETIPDLSNGRWTLGRDQAHE